MSVHTHDEIFNIRGKKFYIGHGDGLNPQDKGYLFIYRIFHNPFLQRCFRLVHPDWGIALARKWSSHSRLKGGENPAQTVTKEQNRKISKFMPGKCSKPNISTTSFSDTASPPGYSLNEKQPLHKYGRLDHLVYLCCF